MNEEPSRWVRRFVPLIEPGGSVLDVACGTGRHAKFFAAEGFRVEAVDRNEAALATLAGIEGIHARQADLEAGPWPYHGLTFDAIVVTRYLFRPILSWLIRSLDTNGVLIYETFMEGNQLLGEPSNPEFLLRRNELLDVIGRRLQIVAFEQGEIEVPRPAVIQRVCATRRLASRLPE